MVLLSILRDYLQPNRVLITIGLLALFWLWESVSPLLAGRKDRLRHAMRNLCLPVINGAILFLTPGAATTVLSGWATRNQFGLLHTTPLSSGWRLIVSFVVLDLWAWLWHRANHRSAFLWRFHRTHHSDFEMDVTTSARFHVGELAMAALTRLPVIVIAGLEPIHILVYETVLVAVSQFHHANISVGCWDRFLRLLIVTPDVHKIHHSRIHLEMNSNFASVLSVWDRLGRSFHMRKSPKTVELGLSQLMDPHWHSVGGMLRTPFLPVPLSSADSEICDAPA